MLLNNPMLNPVHTHDANYFPPAPPMSYVSGNMEANADYTAYKLHHQLQLRRARLPVQSRKLQQPTRPELGLRQRQYSVGVKRSDLVACSPISAVHLLGPPSLLSCTKTCVPRCIHSVAITNAYLVMIVCPCNAAPERSPRPITLPTPLLGSSSIALSRLSKSSLVY